MQSPQRQKALQVLAKRIHEAREEAQLSQASLAKSIGVSDKAISSYEKGRSTPPFEKLQKIAEITSRPLTFFTDEAALDSLIAAKLTTIEQQLQEIKELLRKRS